MSMNRAGIRTPSQELRSALFPLGAVIILRTIVFCATAVVDHPAPTPWFDLAAWISCGVILLLARSLRQSSLRGWLDTHGFWRKTLGGMGVLVAVVAGLWPAAEDVRSFVQASTIPRRLLYERFGDFPEGGWSFSPRDYDVSIWNSGDPSAPLLKVRVVAHRQPDTHLFAFAHVALKSSTVERCVSREKNWGKSSRPPVWEFEVDLRAELGGDRCARFVAEKGILFGSVVVSPMPLYGSNANAAQSVVAFVVPVVAEGEWHGFGSPYSLNAGR